MQTVGPLPLLEGELQAQPCPGSMEGWEAGLWAGWVRAPLQATPDLLQGRGLVRPCLLAFPLGSRQAAPLKRPSCPGLPGACSAVPDLTTRCRHGWHYDLSASPARQAPAPYPPPQRVGGAPRLTAPQLWMVLGQHCLGEAPKDTCVRNIKPAVGVPTPRTSVGNLLTAWLSPHGVRA